MPKVVFIDLFKLFYDRHAIYSLSSTMKQHGVDVHFICERDCKRALLKLAEIKPDLMLYSAFSATVSAYVKFDKIAKKSVKAKSLIGGPGPTFSCKCIENTSINAACIGEGEFALVDFIKGGFRSNKNIFCREDNVPSEFYHLAELDKLPFPDRDAVYRADPLLRDMPSKQFLSGRGCPYECTYCFNHKFRDIFKGYGHAVRKKSIDYLLEEIRLVQTKYPLQNVVFNDDTFILNKQWFLKFCEQFPRKIGLTYTCNIRANLVDEEIAKALSQSNCVGVNWSIESGNDNLRNTILKRGISADQILNTARLLTKFKIPYRIGNMIGLPGETFEQMLQTLELNIKAKPSFGFTSIFVPFPGLTLTKYAIDHGYYDPIPNATLPNLRTRSVMNISSHANKMIQKLLYLFSVFVSFSSLFYNRKIRKVLFCFPPLLLRVLYDAYYAFNMMNIYAKKVPLLLKCRMAMRYIVNSIYRVE